MSITTFVSRMKTERDRWDKLIQEIIDRGFENEIIKNSWTLKDVICHIYWYEKELVKALEQRTLKTIPFWNQSIKTRNQIIYKQTKKVNLREALDTSVVVFHDLVQQIEKLLDTDLKSRSFFKDSKKTVYRLVEGNSTGHYSEHDYKLIKRFDLEKE